VRFALGVEYDGSEFVGWQRQDSGRTVQACVESALSKVADAPVQVICAGRTDTGVHASGQVIHFDSPVARDPRSWVLGGNSNLPRDIAVQWACAVDEDFHARFSATSRSYRYVIQNRMARSGLWSKKVSFIHEPLDAAVMCEAAQCLLGEHDFSTFRAAGCQARHAVREVTRVRVRRVGDFVLIEIEANAFLQHMVRNIVGSLLPIGTGSKSPTWLKDALAARNRLAGGITASPDGLYLTAVGYPARYGVPPAEPAPGPWSAD